MTAPTSSTYTPPSKPGTQTDTPNPNNIYSGEVDYIYSSKISHKVNLEEACEALVSSSVFPLALSSTGRLHYKKNSRLYSKQLDFSQSISGLGMTVTGHQDYLTANPGLYNTHLFQRACDLYLSTKKHFNDDFGFPVASARIFMRPIAMKSEESSVYEIFCPSFRVYVDGTITACITPLTGFSKLNLANLVNSITNKHSTNISSIMCERDLYLALMETATARLTLREKLENRKSILAVQASHLEKIYPIEFLNEEFRTHELLNTEMFTLSELALRLLALAERSINLGAVRQHAHWLSPQYRSPTLDEYWFGKPLIHINNHSNQQATSKENWEKHQHMIQCVMARAYIKNEHNLIGPNLIDLRLFNDYNIFYSEAITLVLATTQVDEFISITESFTFANITCDIQVLNEAAHQILVYYSYMLTKIEKCKTTVDIAKYEIKTLELEASFMSAKKYGETSKHFDHILTSDNLKNLKELTQKKIDTYKKHLELDEKITSESKTRRLTIIFGLIASAALSPELAQPLLQSYNMSLATAEANKILGIALSMAAVLTVLPVIHYTSKLTTRILRKIRSIT